MRCRPVHRRLPVGKRFNLHPAIPGNPRTQSMTVGGLPITATLAAIDRVTQYATMVLPRMNLSVTDSSPSTPNNLTGLSSVLAPCCIEDVLAKFHCFVQRCSPSGCSQQEPSRDLSFRSITVRYRPDGAMSLVPGLVNRTP